MIQTKVQAKNLHSPLRYPGGKACLSAFFTTTIQNQQMNDVTYIEPYAGGAGAGLALLFQNTVNHVVINDYDPAIYAFWKSVTEHSSEFIRKISHAPLTVAYWKKQKKIHSEKNLENILELGFATFYLNRTNRSGVLDAGPIGGMGQLGKWKMDARFNKKNLIERIRRIGDNRHKITVLNMDGVDVIQKYKNLKNVFFYIDPPYYAKGAMLYLNSFNHAKHQQLANTLNQSLKTNWLLSYDEVPQIKEMYSTEGRRYDTFSLRYSVHHNTKSGSELMIFSDKIKLSPTN